MSQKKSPPKVVGLADLKKKREIIAPGPSGNHFKIRPLNLERHALSGGLPAKLRAVAMRGAEGLNELLGSGDDAIAEQGEETKRYLDVLVAEVIVEPDLWIRDDKGVVVRGRFDEEGGIVLDAAEAKLPDPESIEAIPPVDYRWAVAIAMGECDEDGEGRRLWGREPLSRWATFREFHGCAEDCEFCHGLLDHLSAT